MRYGEYLLLGILGDSSNPSNLKVVCEEVGCTLVWGSVCLKNLSKKGYVKKERSSEKGHRNFIHFSLTPSGQELQKYFLETAKKLGLSFEECKTYRDFKYI